MKKKAQKWVKAMGVRRLRELLGGEIGVSTVYNWIYGQRNPTYDRAKQLVIIAQADTANGGQKAALVLEDFLAKFRPDQIKATKTKEPSNG